MEQPALLDQLNALAEKLTVEKDPSYKDDRETGYDAGMTAAGRLLTDLLASPVPNPAEANS